MVTVFAASALIAVTPAVSSPSNYQQAKKAIYEVFGPYAVQAIRVAGCETGGTYNLNAQNGQYLGIFQMGDYARSRYGHSSTSYLIQAVDAYEYFVASGRNWSPWSCKP
jgi:hypothetical protein